MEQAARGAAAIKASNYADAITFYSAAIKQQPSAAPYYIQRSTAYQRTSQYTAALSDAEKGVILATARQKRELIAQAQLRRAIALFGLERFGDAEFVFGIARKLAPKEKSLDIWEVKVKEKLASLGTDDESEKRRLVTVLEMPESKEEDVEEAPAAQPTPTAAATSPTPKLPAATTDPAKIRHDWYQSSSTVTISILAKGIAEKAATIALNPTSISVSLDLPSGSVYDLTIDPLFDAIDTTQSSSKILSTKIELQLRKSRLGVKWGALEGTADPNSTADGTISPSTSTAAAAGSSTATTPSHQDRTAKPPAYPTSSRTGPKDWDRIVSDMSRKPAAKAGAAADSADGSSSAASAAAGADSYIDDDDDNGDEVNAFFKKIYKGADPDTRRAMVKSFQESNGTALSTNWAEVGKGKVETSPPDGMEARPWGS